MKKHRLVSLLVLVVMLSAFAVMPMNAGAATSSPFQNIPINGTYTANGGGTFQGSMNITNFFVNGSQIYANGTLSGSLIRSNGKTLGSVSNVPVTVPVGLQSFGTANTQGSFYFAAFRPEALQQAGTCTILTLTLGPLDLNLLGLMVHLNQVVLNVTAQQNGGLLGNLLCSLAGVLNLNAGLTAITNFLNSLLAVLNSL